MARCRLATYPPDPLPLLREGGVRVREGDKGGEVNRQSRGLIQIAYLGWGSFLDVNLYAGFPEQLYKRIIVIPSKADISPYLGIDQHLGTLVTWGVGGIDGAPLKADAVEGSLDDYILLGMNAPAYLLPCP